MLKKFLGILLLNLLAQFVPNAPTNLSTGQRFDGPAELPRVFINSSMANTPAPGTVVNLAAGGDLQAALNNLQCGQTLTLQAGATWSGKFTFPAKSCDDFHWMIIRTAAPLSSLPAEETRINPCYAGVFILPGRPAFTCPSTLSVMPKIIWSQTNGQGPFIFAAGANHYRLLGLEITRAVGIGNVGTLIQPGNGANHIVIDRNWIHGVSQEETNAGIGLSNELNVAVVDNYMSDFHCTSVIGTCTDAHAVGGGLDSIQAGPFKVNNNFLEGAGQGMLLGGGTATFTPADIEITHNHFFKPLTWMYGQPGFIGGTDPTGACATKYPNGAGQCPFIVKNNLEFKNAQRVLVEGNIFENVWGGFSQVGFQILVTPKNQSGGSGTNLCPTCLDQDITIRYNRLSHSGAGIALANALSDNNGAATAGQRYSVHDITMDDIQISLYNGAGGTFQIFNSFVGTGVLNNVKIDHITGFPDGASSGKIISLGNTVTSAMYGFQFTNSIFGFSKFPIWNTGGTTNCAASNVPLTSLNTCFPMGYTFTKNAFVANSNYPAADWPAGQFFPATVSVIQFVNYNNGNGGNYSLASTSPYKNAGTDGKDLGADVNAINAATAGAD